MISDEKFPKSEHLLKTKDFSAVYKKGRSFRNGPFVLFLAPNSLGYNRVGFSISSKKVKSASSRNRLKRLLREAYRKEKRSLKGGFDIIMVVREDVGRPIFYSKIKEVFLKLVSKTGSLR